MKTKKHVHYKLLSFFIILQFFLSLSGCRDKSSDSMLLPPESETVRTVAIVRDEAITRQDLDAVMERIPKRKRSSIIHSVLDELIEARVFAEEALEAGMDKDPNIKKTLDKVENETLARFFVIKHLDKDAEPSHEEINKFYSDHQDQFLVPEAVLIQHIVVKDRTKCDHILNDLNTGESLGELVKQYSICSCAQQEGQHKWLFRGKMDPDLEKVAFGLERGKLSNIIKTKDGFQIIKILDKRDQRQIPLEEAQLKIRQKLFWENKNRLIDKYYEAARVNFHPEEEGVIVSVGDEQLTEESIAPVLAKFPGNRRQKARDRKIKYFIETKVFSREAKKVHIEKDPDFIRELRRRKDRVLANIFREQFITDKFEITDKDLVDYYQAHREEFLKPVRLRAKSILVNAREEAEEILRELQEKETPFGYLATKKSLYPKAKDRAGEIGWFGKGEKDPVLEEAAFSLEKGEISNIIKTQAGYEIIKLMDKKGGDIQPFDEVKPSIKMALIMQKFEQEKQRYYKKAGVKVFGP